MAPSARRIVPAWGESSPAERFREHGLSASDHAGHTDDFAGTNGQIDVRQRGFRLVTGEDRYASQHADFARRPVVMDFAPDAQRDVDEAVGWLSARRLGACADGNKLPDHFGRKLSDRYIVRGVAAHHLAAAHDRDTVGNLRLR